jgi:uncharacterized membrane protein
MRFLRSFNWKTILLFAAAGPAVGAVLVLILTYVVTGVVWMLTLKKFIGLIMVFLVFGYVMGFLPALVTGVLFSVVQSGLVLQGPWRMIALVAVGASCGALITGGIFWEVTSMGIGACSGAVCAALACRMECRARGMDS